VTIRSMDNSSDEPGVPVWPDVAGRPSAIVRRRPLPGIMIDNRKKFLAGGRGHARILDPVVLTVALIGLTQS